MQVIATQNNQNVLLFQDLQTINLTYHFFLGRNNILLNFFFTQNMIAYFIIITRSYAIYILTTDVMKQTCILICKVLTCLS